MIQLAIDERVLRNYFGGEKSSGYDWGFRAFDHDGAVSVTAITLAVLIEMFRNVRKKGVDSMKFGKVKNCVCNLDGSVSCTITKSTEMKPVKKELYDTLTKHYDQKFHYLIPIKSYFELIVLPTKDDKIKTSDQKKTLAFCERLDFQIQNICEKIIQESIIKEKKILSKLYNVILSSGEKTTVSQSTIEQTKYSLYLSYRNHLNQIFYEMVNSSDLSDLIDFVNENLFSNDSKLIGNIFSLFKKKYPWVI